MSTRLVFSCLALRSSGVDNRPFNQRDLSRYTVLVWTNTLELSLRSSMARSISIIQLRPHRHPLRSLKRDTYTPGMSFSLLLAGIGSWRRTGCLVLMASMWLVCERHTSLHVLRQSCRPDPFLGHNHLLWKPRRSTGLLFTSIVFHQHGH